MTPQQIKIVRGSWNYVMPIMDEAGDTFYEILFERAPELRSLFKGKIKDQSRKLMAMLNIVVSKLDKLETITKDISNLAKRHDTYGAKAEHYPIVGEVLISTLKHSLGSEWTSEIELAWKEAYQVVSNSLMEYQDNK